MDSTSDERTENNTLRHGYRKLDEREKRLMLAIKDHGAEFLELCTMIGESRELSLAKTHIETAVFWAAKHVTK